MSSDLGRRVGVAAVLIPVGIGVIAYGGLPLALAILLIAGMAMEEFFALARRKGVTPQRWLALGAVALLIAAVSQDPGIDALTRWGWLLAIAVALFGLARVIWRPGPGGAALSSAAVTVAGFLYAGGTLTFALLLRSLPDGIGGGPLGDRWEGAVFLLFPLAVTWVSDSAAYFVGRAVGRRKLIPSVSPGKTVEGALGGLAGAVLCAGALHHFVLLTIPGVGFSLGWSLLMGGVLGAVAQLGDLAESVLKREAGAKDSGSILPGHGGVLDRFDAVFFTLPTFWLLLQVGLRLG